MFEELEITLTERNTLQDAFPVNLLADHNPANIKEINFVLPLEKEVTVKQLYCDGKRFLQTDQLFKKVKGANPSDLSPLVPGTGLEPAHLSIHAPETCASTNSAIRALGFFCCCFRLCPGQDLNLHRLWRLPPQSSVSTNSTTWAALSRKSGCKSTNNFRYGKIIFEIILQRAVNL